MRQWYPTILPFQLMIMRHLGVRFRKTRVVYAGEWIRGDGKSNGRKGVPYSGLTGIRKDGGSEPGNGETGEQIRLVGEEMQWGKLE